MFSLGNVELPPCEIMESDGRTLIEIFLEILFVGRQQMHMNILA